jgi:ParB-like chromosome segregation protein Spo0J
VPTLKRHEYSALFPPMSEQGYADLVASIKADGLLEPITLCEGRVLDGWHRYTACCQLDIEPRSEDLGNGVDPLAFVVARNARRRHMTEGQLAMLAAKLADMKQGQRTDLTQSCAKSQADAAERFGVSRRSVQKAVKLRRAAVSELTQAVEQGRLNLSAAERLVNQHPSADDQRSALEEHLASKQPRADGHGINRKTKRDSDREKIWQTLKSLDRVIEELAKLQSRYDTKTVADTAHRRDADVGSRWQQAIDQLQRLHNALPKKRKAATPKAGKEQ